MDIANKIWLPFALLLAVWGAFDVILKTIEMQNKTRDQVRDKPRALRMEVFWSDWFWLWLGSIWFLAIFAAVIIFIPFAMELEPWASRICWLTASLPGFACIGVLIGGGNDIKVFTHADTV